MANPTCFFDCTIGGEPAGRIVFEVRVAFMFQFFMAGNRSEETVWDVAVVCGQGIKDRGKLPMPLHR